MSITLTLTPGQEAWLGFSSIEEAARSLIDERIAEYELENDELEWARPLLEEARADVARSDVITLEEHRARNAARLAALRK